MEIFLTIGSYSDRYGYFLVEILEYQGEVVHPYPPISRRSQKDLECELNSNLSYDIYIFFRSISP